ncbi:MAG: DUF1553 domain-containing protein [Planctomycetes bacterium]|nr:DUF1553 domain-containing protein [Planctomycetota bacterium]
MLKKIALLGVTLAAAVACGAIAFSGGTAGAQELPPDKATTTKSPEREVSNRIDAEIKKVWERDKIKPTDECSDEEFIRRVYLDTVGLPPTADEVIAFTADKEKEKRRTLIARLVDDRRFGEHIADLWTNIMLGRSGRDFGGSSHLFAEWFSERINKGDKFSDIIYDLIAAEGSLSENPAVAIYVREVPFKTANSAGVVTKNLTGVQIQCAECHDHPYEDSWKQETFNGIASFWSPIQLRLNVRNVPADPAISDNDAPLRPLPDAAMEKLPAEVREARKVAERYNKPITLDGKEIKTENRKFWRPAMAKWMVSSENKQTANYIANRFWSFAFGMGILNPVDDFNSFNEPSHPELLEFLGQDLIDNKYDIKRLYRAILNSKTYQLSSRGASEKAESWHFASAAVRQLNPEQFFGTFVEIAGGNDLVKSLRMRSGSLSEQMRKRYTGRMKQMEKSDDPNMRDYYFDEEALNRFAGWYDKMDDSWVLRRTMAQGYARVGNDDEMLEADGFSLTIDQALLVMNGDVTNNLSGSRRGTLIWKLVNEVKSDDERLEKLYLTVLSRRPTSSEAREMKAFVKETGNVSQAYEDIMFALLASSEFATNH